LQDNNSQVSHLVEIESLPTKKEREREREREKVMEIEFDDQSSPTDKIDDEQF
jgi:predicted protein tyrosine phosphatase